MATRSCIGPPDVVSVTVPGDPSDALVDVAFAHGTLRVIFIGDPDHPGIVTVETGVAGGRQEPIVVNGVPYRLTMRLHRPDGDAPWCRATGIWAYWHASRAAYPHERPTDAAYPILEQLADAAASAAVRALPHGWDQARVRFLTRKLDDADQAVGKASKALEAALGTQLDLQQALAYARNSLDLVLLGAAVHATDTSPVQRRRDPPTIE